MIQRKYDNIDEFLGVLPSDEATILMKLRNIIFDSIPDIVEYFSYNVPFYKRNSTICFLWPSTITWGNTRTYSGIRFGFSKGYLLEHDTGYLFKGSRKYVYWRDISEIQDIDHQQIRKFLYEAKSLDAIFSDSKKMKK